MSPVARAALLCTVLGCAATPPRSAPEPAAPRVALRLTVEAGMSYAQPILASDDGVRLESFLTIERRTPEGWVVDHDGADFPLVTSCSPQKIERCTTLAPGATLKPAPWVQSGSNLQCEDRCAPIDDPDFDCYPIRPAVFRFVARECDGPRVFASEPFDLAAFASHGAVKETP